MYYIVNMNDGTSDYGVLNTKNLTTELMTKSQVLHLLKNDVDIQGVHLTEDGEDLEFSSIFDSNHIDVVTLIDNLFAENNNILTVDYFYLFDFDKFKDNDKLKFTSLGSFNSNIQQFKEKKNYTDAWLNIAQELGKSNRTCEMLVAKMLVATFYVKKESSDRFIFGWVWKAYDSDRKIIATYEYQFLDSLMVLSNCPTTRINYLNVFEYFCAGRLSPVKDMYYNILNNMSMWGSGKVLDLKPVALRINKNIKFDYSNSIFRQER